MRYASKKRAAVLRRRKQLVAALGEPLCVRCGAMADDLHEVLSRARGGRPDDPQNTVPLCRPCHDFVTQNPLQAHAEGLAKHAWEAAQ